MRTIAMLAAMLVPAAAWAQETIECFKALKLETNTRIFRLHG